MILGVLMACVLSGLTLSVPVINGKRALWG